MITRREFLGTTGMLALGACGRRTSLAASQPVRTEGRLPLGFSTLGCPGWDWPKVLAFAAANGYAGVELRGILSEMDLTRVPAFAPEHIAEARQQVTEHHLRLTCLGASANMHEMEPARRDAAMDE